MASELTALSEQVSVWNSAWYQLDDPDAASKRDIAKLGQQLGLVRMDGNLCADGDGITSLEVSPHGHKQDYIPYSNQPMNWHTDGYYNAIAAPVRAFILHCRRPAEQGGENSLLDPEYIYIRLRDLSVDLIAALMEEHALTIPENRTSAQAERPAQSGPVFSVDTHTGHLHMRYTARVRSIVWKTDSRLARARAAITGILEEDRWCHSLRLQPGQGVVANNVLHRRAGFDVPSDGTLGRLIYRARYYQRIRVGTPPVSAKLAAA
uniref:Dioxygenase-like protein n=1 Tax=uncultured bacterium ws156A7 TaxID=1131828 RepID=I1X4R8_9BACT|nr:dioxygenase-like protein [uncultured bacterium ws156A7]